VCFYAWRYFPVRCFNCYETASMLLSAKPVFLN